MGHYFPIIVNSNDVGANNVINLKVKTMKKKHYLVYKTTCLLNGKIYIGQHQTYELDDGYIGSGIALQKAIDQFGRENFKREILFDFDNFEDMDNKERELVTEEFVNREDTYNLMVGGQGYDFYVALKNGLNNSVNNCSLGGQMHSRLLKEDPIYRERYISEDRERMKRLWKEQPELFKNFKFDWTGKHHTEETKHKISESIGDRHGEKNNAFGTVWIYNENTKQNKMVKKELMNDFLNNGWKVGRRMDFYK